jgi:tyrosine-specific transport protein
MAQNKVFNGALLVTGTCIGAGMLGLPVTMAASGVIPTIACFIAVWAIMTLSALAFSEASLAISHGNNLTSMAQYTLGKAGKAVAWITYVFFFYSLMAAYISGGTSMTAGFLNLNLSTMVSKLIFMAAFITPFMLAIALGHSAVEKLNKVLVLGLKVSFGLLAIKVLFMQDTATLNLDLHNSQPKFLLRSLPLVVTSFGYHLLIPSLKSYLNNNRVDLNKSIFYGGLLSLVIYTMWILIVYLRIPVWGNSGLVTILNSQHNILEQLINKLGSNDLYVQTLVGAFSFFALTSSLLGVGLALFDFLVDGTKLNNRKTKDSALLLLLTFGLPVLFTMVVKGGFLIALNYAGVFGAILLIIFPILMVWSLRYSKNEKHNYRAPINKLGLLLILGFGIVVIICEVLGSIMLLPIPR